MTSDNGTAQGFTNYGRPVTITVETTATASDRPHNVNDVYTLLGANYQPIAENLKTYAFARAAALRWSRMIGEPVSLYRHGHVEISGELHEALALEDTISAHAMNAADFAIESLAAERGRLVNVTYELRAVEMDVRAMREDAESAIEAIDTLAGLLDAPGMPIVEMARAAAERYETLEWYVLVRRDDADMIGELTAS